MATIPLPSGFFTRATLGPDAAEFYQQQGYLVLTDGFSGAEIATLRSDAAALCRGDYGELNSSDQKQAEDADAFAKVDFAGLSDSEILARFLCIHYPHKASPIMERTLAHPALTDVLTRVIGPNVKCMQSMLFIKAAGKPGQAWHQDEFFIPTRDRSLTGAWIALDDADVDNGCLWVIPGSHRPGVIWPTFPHDDDEYDCMRQAFEYPYPDEDAVPVEVPAGAVVFFNGYLLHKSLKNRKPGGFRRALVNHYMSAESPLPWGASGDEPVSNFDHRDIVMVAGKDPYAWKGIADVRRPHVRPAGDGGCGDGRIGKEEARQKLASSA